jgi:CheY-like chemotaxis protein
MIVSDYKMPGLDGRQLYEKLRSRERTKTLPFIFLASRGDIDEKLRPMVEGVEDFIVKPFFLKDFVRRAKKVVDRLQLEKMQQRSARPGVIQGRLEEMSIMDLLQSIEMGQKSCKLTVTHNSEKCEMFFAGGTCRHAVMGSTEGDAAVYKAVAWSDGEFEIDFSGTSDKSTITKSTQGLLMEAFRLIDEANRDAADAAS